MLRLHFDCIAFKYSTKLPILFIALLSALMVSACEKSGIATYDGIEDFGFQLSFVKPFTDWFPDTETSTYHFGLSGPGDQYVSVDFLPYHSQDSVENIIGLALNQNLTDIDILSDSILNQNNLEVQDYRVSIPSSKTAPYIRVAVFQFDNDHWAVVHGQSDHNSEKKFNKAFDTLLWSLKPYSVK